MISWLLLVLGTLGGVARSRVSLSAENAILRQQLAVLQRGQPRPVLRPADRALWIWLARCSAAFTTTTASPRNSGSDDLSPPKPVQEIANREETHLALPALSLLINDHRSMYEESDSGRATGKGAGRLQSPQHDEPPRDARALPSSA